MKKIKLSQGKYALVDNADYDWLNQYKWSLSNGYVISNSPKKTNGYRNIHRFILKPPKGKVIDHINHNKLDNRRSNLRICSQGENNRNRDMRKKRQIGVCFDNYRKMWMAYISFNNKDITIGRFYLKRDALLARDKVAKKLHKEFATLNFKNP